MIQKRLPLLVLLGACLGACTAAQAAACDNVYQPTDPAWRWVYRAQGQTDTVHYEPAPQGVTEVHEQRGNTQKVLYQCAGGALTNMSVPQFGAATVTRASVTGASVPAAPLWKLGYAWTSVWNLTGKQGLLRGDGTFERHYRIMAREKVSVPAGTFDTWRIDVNLHITGKAGLFNINRDIGEYTLWYAEGIGIVREQHKDGLTELLELRK